MEQISDNSDQQPGIKLLPGETLVSVVKHKPRKFDTNPSSLEQMMRLTRSKSPNRIGENGPSIASLAFEVTAKTSVGPGESPLYESAEDEDLHVPVPEHLRLYEVVFGRDSLRVAIDLISSYPELARATTLRLAELQGVGYEQSREEEPGRIVHEARDEDDPIARELSERLGWGWPYYGSVDATPEFIRTLTAYCRRTEENHAFLSEEYTDKTGETRSMAYALDIAVDWILKRMDSNPQGLLEFKSVLPKGIENQAWKDSWDAYHHSDGTLANHAKGIASIEIQVTTYDALLDAADMYENVLDTHDFAESNGNSVDAYDRATDLREHAKALKQTIFDEFWTEDKGGYFVLGTDRDDQDNLRQLKIRTSNMGHVLNSRLLEGDDSENIRKREAVIQHLLSPEMLNVSGIRTLASDEVRFRPDSYHCGSVWLWDTHHIAKGMRRLGYGDKADFLDRQVLDVINATKAFPEYVSGDDSEVPHVNTQTVIIYDSLNQRENKLIQPPQEVQAWTVAAILAIKKRLEKRGLFPDQRQSI